MTLATWLPSMKCSSFLMISLRCANPRAPGKRVIAAGLDQDLGEPFGPVPKLLALADEVTKQMRFAWCAGALQAAHRE